MLKAEADIDIILPASAPATSTRSRILPIPPRLKLPDRLRALYLKFDVPKQDWGLPSGEIICFAHQLVVPGGKFVGKPLRLRRFQVEFVRDVYNPRDTNGLRLRRQAILSVGRRSGKTLLAALLVLVHLAGPCKRPNSSIVSAATTRKQASLVYRMCSAMIRANLSLQKRLKVLNATKTIVHRGDESTYSAISADAGGSFGEGLDCVVFDEMAQSKNSLLYDALMTSLGSQISPLMLIISTQAASNDHLLSELIDFGLQVKAGEIEDDSFTVHLYAASPNAKLDDEREWYKANPGLNDFRDKSELAKTVQRAMKVPSLEASVRNLYLNQRVERRAPFLTASVWEQGNGPVNETILHDGRPVYAGLDLSERTDLSALVLAAEADDGVIELFPRIWTPDDTLDDRALRDRAPYRTWADKGWLIPVPGQVLDYDWLVSDVGEIASKTWISKLAYDMWRMDVFRQAMQRIGLAISMMPFGQGFKSMSPALEIFEQLALEGKIRHGGQPVLRWMFSNAVVEADAARNRKIVKKRSIGRIDAAIAAIMAVAAMKLQTEAVVDVSTMIG